MAPGAANLVDAGHPKTVWTIDLKGSHATGTRSSWRTNYAPMYPTRPRRVKTDRRDARMLAEAARVGSYRSAHRVSAEQRHVRRRPCTVITKPVHQR